MPRTRHRRGGRTAAGLVGVALAAFALGAVPAAASIPDRVHATGMRKHRTVVIHRASAPSAKHRMTAAQKARERRRLAAMLRRNPRVALRKSFLKRAAFVDYSMPLTVRLNPASGGVGNGPRDGASDDALEIAWNTDTQSWPLPATTYVPSVAQTVALRGRFSLEWRFGSDTTGYTTLGTSEALVGAKTEMTATPIAPLTSIAISDFGDPPTCTGTDQPALEVADHVSGTVFEPGMAISSAGVRYGTINPFGGVIRGNLNLYFSFRSKVRGSCGAAQDLTKLVMPAPGGDPTAVGAARPVPVSFLGDVVLSPAITNDGQLQLGRITIDDAVIPQESSFGQIYSCTVPDPTPPASPPAATCGPGDGDAQPFPARVKIKRLTAQLLIGDAPA